MNHVNKTLYIPLYGKASVSRKGILLSDPKAEEIWDAEGFPLKGKAASKWLTFYMGMRSAVFDRWLQQQMKQRPEAVILHIGCGLDSRVTRVGTQGHAWYDVDFPEVIAERKRYFAEDETYHMLASDIREPGWLSQIPGGVPATIVMEGVSMYLTPGELRDVLHCWTMHFSEISLLMDCYTDFAAKASRYKNPINEVGVTQVYGCEDPQALCGDTTLRFLREWEMTPEDLICQLKGTEQLVFRRVFAGKLAKKLYRLYEFHSV